VDLMTSQQQIDQIRKTISAMDTAIRAAAKTAGFTVVDEENAFAGHEECTGGTWVNSISNFGNDDESLHPNVAGYQKVATDLKAALGA
jgi:lysophospholipase L1-like esterase